MEVLEALRDGKPQRKVLGSKVLEHADTLRDGLSDQQYLDMCNGAQVLHECFCMHPGDVKVTLDIINLLSTEVVKLRDANKDLKNAARYWKRSFDRARSGVEKTKGTMLKNIIQVESAIKKKAYRRVRQLLIDQKQEASESVFNFDE